MFITFYSFKGGVGRTLALANVATLLAKDTEEPCRVLAWDFDLAAPGLQQVVGCSWKGDKLGFVDYVSQYRETAAVPDIKEHIHPTSIPGLDVLPAGHLDRSYAKKLDQIRWREIYRRARGFDFIEATKKQIASLDPPYDYILIDSLTGYSDVGGICVKQLPDAVVLVFRLNQQNLSGITRIYNSIMKTTSDRRRITQVIPVISPAWPFAAPEANAWIMRARRLFKEVKLLEVSFEGGLTFGEKVISRDKRPYAMTSKVVGDYRRLASHIRSLNSQDRRTIFRSLDHLMTDSPEKALDSCIALVLARPQKSDYWEKLVPIVSRLNMTEKPLAEKGKQVINKGCEAENPFAFLAQAKLRTGQGALDLAFEDLSKVIELAPKLAEPYLMRGANRMEREDYARAVDDLSKFIDMRPATPQLATGYVNRAECLMFLSRPKEAVADLSEAILLQPRNKVLLESRSRALFMADEYEEALKDFNQAVEIARPSRGADSLQILQAHLLLAAGQRSEGIEVLRLLESQADDLSGLLNIAEAYLTVDPDQSCRILGGIKKPETKTSTVAMLLHLAAIIRGKETAREAIEAARQLKDGLKESTWSWFEIRQFLRWGVKQGILNQEKRDGIAQLIDFIEAQSRRRGMKWSLGGDMDRLEQLTFESWQLRIPRTSDFPKGHHE
ncbi:MAG TPA: AAA family ATPase [Candidatus Dormibacteraeota bacterium]|nr:AAA family ATPase [Candidatus Dormibacteraeota bacterium]